MVGTIIKPVPTIFLLNVSPTANTPTRDLPNPVPAITDPLNPALAHALD